MIYNLLLNKVIDRIEDSLSSLYVFLSYSMKLKSINTYKNMMQ